MKVLIADPDPDSRDALRRAFAEAGDHVRGVATIAEAETQLASLSPDALIAAVRFPDADAAVLFELAGRTDPHRALFAVVDASALEDGVRAMQLGAQDFVWRPVSLGRVALLRARLVARRERERWMEQMRIRLARTEMAASLPGSSPLWKEALAAIERMADSAAPVLITGEHGTEKEAAARAIHRLSPRGSEPFEVAADGETLAGASSGEGTLFVRSIERVSRAEQRALAGELERPGGRRFVVATDQEPGAALAAGRLIPDILERVENRVVHLPPLRDRGDDVERLARQFLHELDDSLFFDAESIDVLRAHDWPANVVELREVVSRASRLAEGPAIRPTVVTSVLGRPLPKRRARRAKPPVVRIAVGASLADVERRLIQKTLEFSRGSKPKTAALLKLSLKTIYNKIKEYGLEH
jgi:DNA-binding NtrC family response regulator